METDETKTLRQVFGKILREKRKERSFSQEELAHRAGLTTRYISLLECDKRQPTISTVYLLAQALGLSMAEFITEIERSMPGAQ